MFLHPNQPSRTQPLSAPPSHVASFMHLTKCSSSAYPEGGDMGSGPPPPWKITSYMGFYRERAIGPPWKSCPPPPPLENAGPPLEP